MHPIVETHWGLKPSRSKVEIEELDCDLMAGVRIAPLEADKIKEAKPPAWPCVFYTTVSEKNWLNGEVGTFHLIMESSVKTNKVKPANVWYPFTCQDAESCDLVEAKFVEGGKKYQKVVQKFLVRLCAPEEGRAHVPYVQFHCGQEWVRHGGTTFKDGNLLTIVINHPTYPLHWPRPPIITVVPSAAQTFVPMLPKQKMIIVTDQEQTVDFKGHANSTIKHSGMLESDFGKECNYFCCTKPSQFTEIIFVNQKKKPKFDKKVIIPFCEKEIRYPIILNPLKDSVLHAQNIDGFFIRFWKDSYHPVIVMNGCPVRAVFTNENAQYIERRFEIDKRRPFFYFEKKDHSWVIT